MSLAGFRQLAAKRGFSRAGWTRNDEKNAGACRHEGSCRDQCWLGIEQFIENCRLPDGQKSSSLEVPLHASPCFSRLDQAAVARGA